jgi:hypothetical protein
LIYDRSPARLGVKAQDEVERIVGGDVGPCEIQAKQVVPEIGGFTIGYLGTDTQVLINVGDPDPHAREQLEALCRARFGSNGTDQEPGKRLPSADVGDSSCYSSGADGSWFALLASTDDLIVAPAVTSSSPTLASAQQLAKLAFGRLT